jgi:hypothetical protein
VILLVIVVKNHEYQQEITNNENINYLVKVCHLKNIKSESNCIVLIDVNIDDEGVVTDYDFFLEEVIITIPIDTIICNFDNKKVREICDFHKLNLLII